MEKKKLLRITTVPISLVTLLHGQLKFIKDNDFDVLSVSSNGHEVEQLKFEGIAHVAINMTRKITPLQDCVALMKLVLLMIRFKPHIVHTHTPKAGLLGMLASWICRVPIRLHTIAGLTWMETVGAKRWLLKLIERLTYACSCMVYPNSHNLRNFLLLELGFDKAKTKVLASGSSNGIDSDYFQLNDNLKARASEIKNQYGIPEGEIVFSFVGRIVRDKGIMELTESFVELSRTCPCWLIMVGGYEQNLDPLPAHILSIIKSNPKIIMAGFQQDVRPWLAASDVFILPSHREGFPNVVMQAACMELPCIVSDINGCNEIIQHGSSGLLVPSKNKDALLDAMKLLHDSPSKRKDFAMVAKEFVTKNFNQRFVWNEVLKEYLRISNPKPK